MQHMVDNSISMETLKEGVRKYVVPSGGSEIGAAFCPQTMANLRRACSVADI